MDCKDGKLIGKEVCESVLRFASYPPLKRAALMVVSHHLKEQDTRDLRNMFLTLDEEHSGELTFEEMYKLIQKCSSAPLTEEYFHKVFDQMDHENTGKVHYMEFLAATLESRVKLSGQLLNQAFDHLDVESNGHISIDNFQQLLGKSFSRDDVEDLIKKGTHHCHCDEHDAIVTRSDFIQMMGDAQLPSPSATPNVPDTPTPVPELMTSSLSIPASPGPLSPAPVSQNKVLVYSTTFVETPVLAMPTVQIAIPSAAIAVPNVVVMAPAGKSSLGRPMLPSLSEEISTSPPDSRGGTPMPMDTPFTIVPVPVVASVVVHGH